MVFESFTQVAPISQATFATYGSRVPSGVVQAWRDHGTGFVGDGYFRLVDPARAQQMLGRALPAQAVALFTTAMADVVAWYDTMFLVIKFRLGEIHATPVPFERLVSLMADVDRHRDAIWDWQPYPQAQARLGTPELEDCFMHVPLLGLGGRGDPAQMQTGSVWLHIDLMTQMTGSPRFTHMLPLPSEE